MPDAIHHLPEYPPDPHVVALNYAALNLADELLWLPSSSVVTAAVHLLYGREVGLPDNFVAHVGRGAPQSLAALVVGAPLGTLLPSRLGPAAAWRVGASSLKEARAVSRDRYRQLQAAFVARTAGGTARPAGFLVRDIYAVPGRWSCAESARRILGRVVRLNRAALAVLAALSRGECAANLPARGSLPARSYDLSPHALDFLAEALPPLAMPDFDRLAASLPPTPAAGAGDESIDRYQSLFAEMLSLSGLEVHA